MAFRHSERILLGAVIMAFQAARVCPNGRTTRPHSMDVPETRWKALLEFLSWLIAAPVYGLKPPGLASVLGLSWAEEAEGRVRTVPRRIP